MKTHERLLLVLILATTTPIPANCEVVLEAAWVEIRSGASAANGGATSDDEGSVAQAGLGVSVAQGVSASYFGTLASAATSAVTSFDLLSTTFAVDFVTNLSTSAGVYPVAASNLSFFVDFRVEGQSENPPDLRLDKSSLISTTQQYGGVSPPGMSLTIARRDGPLAPGLLAPGSYRATVYTALLDHRFADGGTTLYSATGLLQFASVSIAPGFNQANPILPQPSNPGQFTFIGAPSGRWFDPPPVEGYTFQTTDGSMFTDILNFPSGFDSEFSIVVAGRVLGTFGAGDSVNFKSLLGEDVSQFQILGISPTVDSQNPLAFPIQLAFTTPTASFTMSTVPSTPKLVDVSIQASVADQPPRFSGTVTNGPPMGTARLEASLDLGASDPWAEVISVDLDSVGSATFTNVPDARPQALGVRSNFFRVVTESRANP